MNSLKRRKIPRARASYEEQIKTLAGLLIGRRIVSGMTDEHLAEVMGILHLQRLPRNAAKRKARISELVRKMELGMVDGRLSTFKRYARVLGLQLGTRLYKRRPTNVVARARAIRHRRKVLARRLSQPRRRLVA